MSDIADTDFRQPRRYVRLDTILRLRWLAMLGQLAAIFVVSQGLGFDLPVVPCLAILGLSVVTLVFLGGWASEAAGWLYGYGVAARLVYGLSAAAMIGGAARSEARLRWPPSLIGIGRASYAIYLFHLIGIGIAWQVGTRLGVALPPVPWFILLVLAGGLLGVAVHVAVERPLLRWMRRGG